MSNKKNEKKKQRQRLKSVNVLATTLILAGSLLSSGIGVAAESVDQSPLKQNEVQSSTVQQHAETQVEVKSVNSTETVVNSFQELKDALENDNGITHVILGNDISLTSAIKINVNKQELTIDGHDHTLTETGGAAGAWDGLYYKGANILKRVTVKNLNVKGKNYYGLITIEDGRNNVEQIFENVNYSGPQMVFNRGGKVIFKGVNDININDYTVSGSAHAHEVAEVGSVEVDGELKVTHDNAHAVFWSVTGDPQFKVASNAKMEIKTHTKGYGIFYATGGYGDFIIGNSANVKLDGRKSLTGGRASKTFIVEPSAEVNVSRTGDDAQALIDVYGETKINEAAKFHVSTENGYAVQAVKVGTIEFDNPEKVLFSSLKSTAINNSFTSLTLNMETAAVKLWEDTSKTPTNTYVSTNGKNFTWTTNYSYNKVHSTGGSANRPKDLKIDLVKVKKIEIGDGQAEKELADAKKKVEDLFTNDEFDTLKDTTDQQAIDEAREAVAKLPAGPEKDRLDELLNKAQDLLNKKEREEKDLADAKKKVEDLFTNDEFDTLKDTTDQQAIDEAREAVAKLPAGPEKDRLDELLNKAQDLLNKKEREEKDLADAKKKVEDLFTNDEFDTLKDTTDQQAIDEAREAVAKLPAGPEKDRLDELLNKAQDLLNKKEREEKDLADAKKKVEDLFTNDKFDTLKDTTDQQAIDEAQEAVNKLPAGPEKDRLQELVDRAKDLYKKDVTAPEAPKVEAVTTASNKVTGTGEAGATVTVAIGGKTYGGTVGADGRYSVNIPRQPVNTEIRVTLTDEAGNRSNATSVKVSLYIPDQPVTIDPVYQNALAVTGQAPEGATIVRLLVNGVAIRMADVHDDGTFSIYSRYVGVDENGKNKVLMPGDLVTVDYGTKTPASIQAHTIVIGEIVKPEVNPVAPSADYVTGKAPAGTQVLRLKVNGVIQRTISPITSGAGQIQPDGSFRIYSRFNVDENGNSRRLQAGDVVEVDYGAQVPGDHATKVIVN
ncbi:toxin Cry1Ac domain D-VI-related protein [Cytobacillus horneckiae]|uniref:toxin Cry1Ac domain D-VI-related protein n=1 Tax=Cytobacillus horneckiae TaxID=549687 RepID=UPI003D9A2845